MEPRDRNVELHGQLDRRQLAIADELEPAGTEQIRDEALAAAVVRVGRSDRRVPAEDGGARDDLGRFRRRKGPAQVTADVADLPDRAEPVTHVDALPGRSAGADHCGASLTML